MKKIILLLMLVIAIALISGSKQPIQNQIAEKYAKPARLKGFKGVNKFDLQESNGNQELFTSKNAPESSPGILFILQNDNGLTSWSPSLWWSYKHTKSSQKGC